MKIYTNGLLFALYYVLFLQWTQSLDPCIDLDQLVIHFDKRSTFFMFHFFCDCRAQKVLEEQVRQLMNIKLVHEIL